MGTRHLSVSYDRIKQVINDADHYHREACRIALEGLKARNNDSKKQLEADALSLSTKADYYAAVLDMLCLPKSVAVLDQVIENQKLIKQIQEKSKSNEDN